MTAYDVLHYIAEKSGWGRQTQAAESDRGEDSNIGIVYKKIPLLEVIEEFSRGAAASSVVVLGRCGIDGAHVTIPFIDWLTICIDPNTTLRRQTSQTGARVIGKVPFYTDLRISRADVYRVWPPAKIAAIIKMHISRVFKQ